MSRALAYAVVALVAYGATLVVRAPASWLADAIDEASGHRLQFRETSGTIWEGNARLFARSSERLLDLGTMRWTARPAATLPPAIRAELRLAAADKPVRLDMSLSSMALGPLALQLPASVLTAIAPPLATLGPGGTLHVRADNLRLQRAAYFGVAEIEWRRASLQSHPGIPLGSHVARARGTGDRVDIDLATLEGGLSVTGKATWRPSGAFEIAGTAEPRQPELVPLVKAFCATYQGASCPFSYRSAR